uniref:F-box domain-containing protein n=1 Tax=Meloidogyne enterolobii TaxID=390850 RepID=A0A6V7WDL0_MELEN|nr:unnamed protein product [Meloidogyne enterolobii]
MFYSLPTETKLDIFKCLNYNQLCSVKQTNLYFRDFINNFDGELAREKLHCISFGYINQFKEYPQTLIKPKAKNFDFLLNEELEKKFKNGLEKTNYFVFA